MAQIFIASRPRHGLVAWLLITIGINVLALIVVNWLFTSVGVSGFWSYALGALALGLGNTFLKPILAVLTLPLIVVSLGVAYFALNVAMVALAEWIAPRFSVDGFWTYVGATIVIWLVNVALRGLAEGVSRPSA
ncbi:MAG TPA: phage holin family protein [Gaiellaceae bacterium]|nr:phage holin family protein [Gaiellaceae bacterium]